MLPAVTPPTTAPGTLLATTDTSSASTPGSALAAIGNLAWKLPFTGPVSASVKTCASTVVASAVMNGAPATTYNVRLRFHGVIELKAYTGGSNDLAYWQVGGTPSGTVWNTYKLEISSPAATYYLNRGIDSTLTCYAVNYTKTVQIDTGATVTMTADSNGSEEVYHTVSNGEVTNPAQPYYGQFINMEVLSVT